MKHFNLLNNFRWLTTVILLITLGTGLMWGDTDTYDFNTNGITKSSGPNGGDQTSSSSDVVFTSKTGNTTDSWTISFTGNTYYSYGKSNGVHFGKNAAAPHATMTSKSYTNVTDVTINTTAGNASVTIGVSVGGTSFGSRTSGSNTSHSFTHAAATGAVQISIESNTNGRFQINSIVITYSSASCSANPSIGDASLNGSFNMTSTTSAIGVASGTCSTGNAACDWTDYGFVWSDGTTTTTPTVSNNKVQVGTTGSGTSWTGSVTPSNSTTPTSWTTGHTYYVRTYGKNSKTSASYYYSTNALTFTPRSITFNSNGGSSVDTKYVNSGTSVTKPTNPTKTGYNFDNWYTTSGLSTTMNFSGTITKDTTLYAKWNAKTYNITLDREGATTGATGVTMTYNSSSFTGWSAPSKTGYTFGGYWTGDDGTGTMVIDASGNLQAGVTNYTGAGGIWTKDATCTLYAKWTAINYTVTWKVNDVAYTTGTPSDNADYGTAWSSLTLPTDPDPASYCGQVFVGWTTDNIGVTGLDKDDDDDATRIGNLNLMTSANKSSKSTTITGNTIFYAVFADYTTD